MKISCFGLIATYVKLWLLLITMPKLLEDAWVYIDAIAVLFFS